MNNRCFKSNMIFFSLNSSPDFLRYIRDTSPLCWNTIWRKCPCLNSLKNPKDMRNKILKKLSKLTTSKKTVQKIAQKRYGKNMFRFIFVCSLESFVSSAQNSKKGTWYVSDKEFVLRFYRCNFLQNPYFSPLCWNTIWRRCSKVNSLKNP